MGVAAVVGFGVILLLALASKGRASSTSRSEDVPIEKDIADAIKEIEKESSVRWDDIETPSSDWATNDQWRKYVKLMASGRLGTITKANFLGLFYMGARTLEDIGYLTNVKKDTDGVWRGTWVPPLTQEKFLASRDLQYDAFVKMTDRHAETILKRYKPQMYDVSKASEGKFYTLSGLLAVAKMAGLGGLDKWINGDRKESTTKEFAKFNAIF